MCRSIALAGAGLLFMTCGVGVACAGTLYVCEGAHGVKAYQDTPCPSTSKTTATGSFKSTPYAASPVPAPTAPADADAGVTPQPVPQPAPTEAPAPVGWICETGARRWLQFSRCPATYLRGAPVDVDGFIAGTGQMVHGTGTVDVPTPVQSTPLDRNGVCAALGDRSLRIPHHGSSDTYERNMLRSQYCGG